MYLFTKQKLKKWHYDTKAFDSSKLQKCNMKEEEREKNNYKHKYD